MLGVETGMASPSYSIVNEYRSHDGNTVYHFDLYRLNKAEELEGIGFPNTSTADITASWNGLKSDKLPTHRIP